MSRALVFLADGFEEIEGLTVVDLLRRAGIETRTVAVTGSLEVTGSHGIQVRADMLFEDMDDSDTELYVLPGGMPGTKRLAAHTALGKLLQDAAASGKKVAAICAAPSVLGGLGILEGRRATSYPGFEEQLSGAELSTEQVVVSGNITTSRGMGTAIPFGLALVAQLSGQAAADQLAKKIIFAGNE